MKFAYLLIMLFTLSYPLYKSFESNVHYYGKWRYVFRATIPVALFFILWDNWFTSLHIWEFNPEFVLGFFIGHLPLEEYLFFFFVPFSCIFIHEVMYYFVKKDVLGKYAKTITYALIGISLVFISIYYDKTYPVILFSLQILVLLLHLFLKVKHLGRFYLSFAVCILPFLVVNGLLTGLPVIIYNKEEIMQLYIMTIPLEDLFYGMVMLMLITSAYEYFKKKETRY